MQSKKPQPIPAGPGRGTYVAHIIKGKPYWYRHFYDPEIQETRAVREDPPSIGTVTPEVTPEIEKKPSPVTPVTPVPPEFLGTVTPVTPDLMEEMDELIEKLENQIPTTLRSKRSREARLMEESKALFEKIKGS